MLLLYTLGIRAYHFFIRLISGFNTKAKLFVNGRRKVFAQIQSRINPEERPIWFHFASLGEFEQGRPVLEKIHGERPDKNIVVTFFSPSGYEIRKNYALAEVFYLPMDSAKNADHFLRLVNPEMAIFTKYEFWYFYFRALHERAIPLFLISGIFRPEQIYFKWYGGFNRNMLKWVNYFFVQNEESKMLLHHIGIHQVSISGDTRFDRVYENAKRPKVLPEIRDFVQDSPVLVCGSTWPEDEKLIVAFTKAYPEWKLIIAPHEIQESHLEDIEKLFPQQCIRYTQWCTHPDHSTNKLNVLLIDNIGLLSSLYQYGQVAYIGGGFGAGIHNTLEAAAFGLPVIFGPEYHKFQEAKDLLSQGAAKSIKNSEELVRAITYFYQHKQAGMIAKDYVTSKRGATEQIVNLLNSANQLR